MPWQDIWEADIWVLDTCLQVRQTFLTAGSIFGWAETHWATSSLISCSCPIGILRSSHTVLPLLLPLSTHTGLVLHLLLYISKMFSGHLAHMEASGSSPSGGELSRMDQDPNWKQEGVDVIDWHYGVQERRRWHFSIQAFTLSGKGVAFACHFIGL